MATYTVVKPFEHNGRILSPDDTVELKGRQAKYLELNGKVRPEDKPKKKKEA